jgi:nucleoside phosphorylase
MTVYAMAGSKHKTGGRARLAPAPARAGAGAGRRAPGRGSAPLVYRPAVLVVAATELELAQVEGADTLCCGIGPVEAALATARALAGRVPERVLHIGIAGARALEPGALVLGSEAVYCDLPRPVGPLAAIDRVRPDPALLAAAAAALPEARVLPIATSARVGGGHACAEVEAMEGFAVLRAAAVAGVPALELRAVSNAFDAPRAGWRIDEALAALARATGVLVEALGA